MKEMIMNKEEIYKDLQDGVLSGQRAVELLREFGRVYPNSIYQKSWKEVPMIEAIQFYLNKIVVPSTIDNGRHGIDVDFATIAFEDGTAIAARSDWKGPYSKVTPEIECTDPIFIINQ